KVVVAVIVVAMVVAAPGGVGGDNVRAGGIGDRAVHLVRDGEERPHAGMLQRSEGAEQRRPHHRRPPGGLPLPQRASPAASSRSTSAPSPASPASAASTSASPSASPPTATRSARSINPAWIDRSSLTR
ncbi:hypothetical protein EE612_057402, partial [Oryza sativa]